MGISIGATYSAEDNKLRLYPSSRLDRETLLRVKDVGFRWAPKQKLFVAPSWSPDREDLCIELAGDITAEHTTLVERAEVKAARLDKLAAKRERQSNSFHDAATRLSQRFSIGQPLLIGHHSEGKARRDQAKMHDHMAKAASASKAVSYWQYRATGIERHANRKSAPGVRQGRICRLLKELRDRQRDINHAHICCTLWGRVSSIADQEQFVKAAEHWAGVRLKTGETARYGAWSELTEGRLNHRQFVTDILEEWEARTQSVNTFRWINHILNRLGFERSELGDVQRYDGVITASVLQAFLREQGAHRPQATAGENDEWIAESSVPLPAHVADGCIFEAGEYVWRDLMQSCGYCVPEKKERRKSTSPSVPLINPSVAEARQLQSVWNVSAQANYQGRTVGGLKNSDVLELPQAVFSARSKGSYSDYMTIELDENGRRIRGTGKRRTGDPVCRIRVATNCTSVYSADCVIVIADKPTKPLPIHWVALPTESVS